MSFLLDLFPDELLALITSFLKEDDTGIIKEIPELTLKIFIRTTSYQFILDVPVTTLILYKNGKQMIPHILIWTYTNT